MYRCIVALLTIIGLLVIYPPNIVRADDENHIHIVEIQTRTEDDPNNEFLTLYNSSENQIDITDWQLEYATYTADPEDDESWTNKILVADRDKQVQIDPDELILIATNNFQSANEQEVALSMASGTRQAGAQLRLLDDEGQMAEYVAWGDVEQPLHNSAAPASAPDETIARCFDEDDKLKFSADLATDFALQAKPLIKDRLACETTGDDSEDDGEDEDGEEKPDEEDIENDENTEDDSDKSEPKCKDIIISEVMPNGDQFQPFIELINKNDEAQSLSGCKIELMSEAGSVRGPYELPDQSLEPDEMHVLPDNHPATEALFSTVKTTIYLLAGGSEAHYTTYPADLDDDVSWAWFGNSTWKEAATPTPGEANLDQADDQDKPQINPNCEMMLISEILPNPQGPRSQYPREEYAFIELYNPTDKGVSLDNCGVLAESSPRSSDIFWLDGYYIDSNDYLALYEIDTAIALPVNPSGTVHILDKTESILDTATYPESMPEAASWAHIDQEWRITYEPTPGADNHRQDLRPCPDGQERNESTGRCRNINTASSELAPCEDHQYRHPETNRCRNIETSNELVPCGPHQYRHPETNRCRNIDSGNDLVPCGPHQERNPETNRCRNVASAESELVPCEDHQYRHPETNRCRNKVLSNEDSIDTVEDVTVVASGTPPSWWLLGAAVIFALGYAIWEWRYDLQNLLRRSRAPAKPSP